MFERYSLIVSSQQVSNGEAFCIIADNVLLGYGEEAAAHFSRKKGLQISSAGINHTNQVQAHRRTLHEQRFRS